MTTCKVLPRVSCRVSTGTRLYNTPRDVLTPIRTVFVYSQISGRCLGRGGEVHNILQQVLSPVSYLTQYSFNYFSRFKCKGERLNTISIKELPCKLIALHLNCYFLNKDSIFFKKYIHFSAKTGGAGK